jgi:hypothetical protein
MSAQKIMIIRHAEKPEPGAAQGVGPLGVADPEDLIVRGWQRAGALARFFAPYDGPQRDPRLATPQAIFAAAVGDGSKSLRPQHTVLELSTLLGLPISQALGKGDESKLASQLVASGGVTLVAWQHEDIPTIVNGVVGDAVTCPQTWHGSRFDLVWVLDRPAGAAKWTFSQVPQMLLSGDSPAPMPF